MRLWDVDAAHSAPPRCMEAVAQTPAVVRNDNGSWDRLPVDVHEATYMAEEARPDRLHWRDQQRRGDSAGLCNSHVERQQPAFHGGCCTDHGRWRKVQQWTSKARE